MYFICIKSFTSLFSFKISFIAFGVVLNELLVVPHRLPEFPASAVFVSKSFLIKIECFP